MFAKYNISNMSFVIGLTITLASCKSLRDVDDFGGPPATNEEVIIPVSDTTLVYASQSFSFGGASVGGAALTKTVTLSNASSYPISIESIEIEASEHFSIQASNCPTSSAALEASESCQLSLDYSPQSVGNHVTTITSTFSEQGNGATETFTSSSAFAGIGVPSVSPSPVQSVISVSSTSVSSGDTITVTLEGRDSNGNLLGLGGAEVLFKKDSGVGTGSWIPNQTTVPAVDNNDGTYTAQFTGVLAGSVEIGATIDSALFSGTKPSVTVTPGAPASLSFDDEWNQGSPQALANFALNPAPKVSILDSAGNTVSSTAQITLSLDAASTGGTSMIGASQTNAVGGVADFDGTGFGFLTAGNKIITASLASPALSVNSIAVDTVAPTLSITSSEDLVIAYRDNSAPQQPTEKTSTTSTGAYAPAIPDTSSLITAESGSGSSAPNAGITESSAGASWNNLTDESFDSTVTVTRNSNVGTACTVLGVFSSIVCNLSSFSVDFFDLVDAATSGSSSLQIFDGYVNSNSVTVRKYVVSHVANTYLNGTDNPYLMGVFNDKLWFYSKSRSNKYKLFSVDTSGNVVQELNIRGTSKDDVKTSPTPRMRVFNDKMYFMSRFTGKDKDKLISMDTSGNLSVAVDTRGSNNSNDYPESLITPTFENALYFIARNASDKKKLYKVLPDGSAEQITNLRGNNGNDDIGYIREFNGTLYMNARNSNGKLKYSKLDFAGSDLDQVSNFRHNNNGDDSVRSVTVIGDQIFAAAKNQSGKYKLFVINDDNSVAQPVRSSTSTGSDEDTQLLTSNDGKLYYLADNTAGKRKLHVYDPGDPDAVPPVAPSVTQLTNFMGNSQHDEIIRMVSWDGDLYFVASIAFGVDAYKLFRIDSATGQIDQVSNIVPTGTDNPSNFVNFNGALYFKAYSDAFGEQSLFKLEKR